MNTLDLLYPHLISTDNLRNYLKSRLPNLNRIDNMSRDELLVIFSNYAAPLHQRGGTVTTSETNKQQSPSAINPSSETKRYFHSRIKNSNPSNDDAIDNVTSDCKKMKLHTNVQNKDLELNSIKTNDDRMLKRQPPPTTIMNVEESPNSKKRKKITWP